MLWYWRSCDNTYEICTFILLEIKSVFEQHRSNFECDYYTGHKTNMPTRSIAVLSPALSVTDTSPIDCWAPNS